MIQSKKTDLGKDRIGRLFFALAIPAITSQLVNALYNMVDRMYIGHIPGSGAAALTGVGVAFPLIMIIAAFAALVSMGGAPRASIMMGKGDEDQANRILGNCFTAQVITSIVLTVLTMAFCEPLLMMFGASENTIIYAKAYMMIYAAGTIFVQLTLGMNAFISAQGFSRTSMLTVVIGAVTNIVLDPILIFGFDMGVRGAALATVISQAVSTIWVICFLSSKKSQLRLHPRYFRIQPEILFPAMSLGFAPFIMQATESILVLCFNSSLLHFGGDLAVGAMTILSSVMQFSMLPLQGLTQGAQPIISYNYGSGDISRVKKGFKLLLVSCVIYSSTMWVLAMLVPQLLTSIFTADPALTQITVWAMRIYMAALLLMGVQLACQQTFIALGNAKISTFLAFLRKVFLLIPFIYLLPVFIDDKVFAVFLAEPIADVIAVSVTAILFFKFFRKVENGEIHA